MPTLHDLMSQSIDARATTLRGADASPADATRGLIARRRRRNAAVASGTSVLALGAVVAAVVAQGSRGQVPASADPNGIQYVKVDTSGTSGPEGFTDPVFSPSCGATLPATKTKNQNFTQTVSVDPKVSGTSLHVNASLRYDGPDRALAVINPGIAVLTRNGVIMNYYLGNGTRKPLDTITGGETWHANNVVSGSIFDQRPCSSSAAVESSPSDVAYPAGDYQVYVVSQALASAPLVATMELQAQGYFLAPSGQGLWIPGSVDCQRMTASAGGGPVPLQCADPLPAGVSIDAKSHTATLPYRSADYAGELNVTLVSKPITVALDHDVTYSDLDGGRASLPTSQPTSDQPLTCGPVGGGQVFGGSIAASFAQPVSLASLTSGGDVPILVDSRTFDQRSRGTLRLGEGAIASVVVGSQGPGAWVAAQGSVSLAPSAVKIDRAKGYPEASLKLNDMTECAAPTEGPWTIRKSDSPTTGVWLIIQGDLRIDWEDGTTTTATSVALSGASEG